MPGKQFLRIIIGVLAMLAATFMLDGSARAQSKYKTLYRFRGSTNGSGPSGLVIDAAGNLYGTTSGGGTYGYGTVFRLDKAGKKTVLHNFAGAPDGANPHPYATLIFDGQGNLYGTTYVGGAGNQAGGTVFKLDTAGVETVLHNFCYGYPCTDGEFPTAGLLLDDAGNLYGTTYIGGDDYEGTVFKLTPDGHGGWSETLQHAFDWLDGGSVYAGLVQDSANNFHGATAGGGAYTWGTVFKMDSAGAETIL